MKKILYRLLTIIMSIMIVVGISGCSSFLKDMALDDVEEYVYEMIEAFISNPYSIDQYSDADIEFTSLTDEQRELVGEYVSLYSNSISVRKLHINDSRDRASLELIISEIKIFDDSTIFIGNQNELLNIIGELPSHNVTVLLTLTRNRLEWVFDDLSQLEDLFIEPMQSLCVLDDDGNPINITSQYISYTYSQNIVGGFWYDPLSGNPLDVNHMNVTPYLEYVFYFDQPTTLDITVELRYNGETIDSFDAHVEDSMVLDCNYGTDFEDIGYGAGEYTVVLVAEGIDVIESEVLEVR